MTTTNRLSTQTSPYLLQHAHNPVAWYPWGEEALARARLEERPILLSIGYSACHWCHVMERESFENPEIAALMNRHFVCIKVDREERPDLDAIYMDATQALNHGQGGWPMTVFLTPDQKPFFAGTYFPPRDHYGRPGFPRVLMALAEAWARRRGEVVEQAEQLTALVAQGAARTAPLSIPPQALDGAVDDYRRDFDPRHGGFGQAPKFPPSAGLSLLLLLHERGADEALPMVVRTVDGMARGGMYDQIGGGFCRYSTDERWLVPHFEKMLYDNAQLARVYLATQQVTGDPFHRRIAGEILDYVEREMQGPAGGFYSATDADSEGEEGKFFVFTAAELEALLGPEEGRRLGAYFDITAAGNWEGVSIPHTPRTVGEVAAELGIEAAALKGSIARGRAALYAARERRVHPLLDDKILTAWNGLMIGAFAEGARVLGEGRYRRAAERAADYLLGSLRKPDGRLLRTARGDRAHLDGYLEDYAYLVDGLIDLYEAGASRRYLDAALELGELAVADFGDEEEGPFFTTARGHERLIVRHRDGTCGATPSPNATLALALLRLARHFDRPTLGARGEAALWAYGGLAVRHPRAFPKTLQGAAFLIGEPVELALVGTPGEAGYEALVRAVAAVHLPSRVIAHHDPGSGPPPADLPLLRERGLVDGQAALYVCRGATCQAPVVDPAAVGDAVGERRGRAAVTAT